MAQITHFSSVSKLSSCISQYIWVRISPLSFFLFSEGCQIALSCWDHPLLQCPASLAKPFPALPSWQWWVRGCWGQYWDHFQPYLLLSTRTVPLWAVILQDNSLEVQQIPQKHQWWEVEAFSIHKLPPLSSARFVLTLSVCTRQTRWDNFSFTWTCKHMGKIDEVLRAYLCQFTFINTLSALPSLGFYLRLITLYLLMPCRNTHLFPPVKRSWIQRRAHFSCSLLGHWHLCLSKMQLEKIPKPFSRGCCCRRGFIPFAPRHQTMLLETSFVPIPGIYCDQTFKSTTFPKHKIPRKRVLERTARQPFAQREAYDNFSFCSCDLPLQDWKELWAHTQESRKSLPGITCKIAQFEKHAAERMKPDCKGERGFFFHPWIGFRTSSQSESLYILAICHFQSIRPYALLTIILNHTY